MKISSNYRIFFKCAFLLLCFPSWLSLGTQQTPPVLLVQVAQNDAPVDWDAPVEGAAEDAEFQALLEEIYENSGQSSNQIFAEQQAGAEKYAFLQGYGLLVFMLYILGLVPNLLFFHRNETVKTWSLELNFLLIFFWFLSWPIIAIILVKKTITPQIP